MSRQNTAKEKPVKDLIKESGHEFHFKVVKFLKEKGWSVLISPYYTDNMTDKSREIDIIAEKKYDIRPNYRDRNKPKKTLTVRLFIECKYINRTVYFWFDDIDKMKAIDSIREDIPFESPKNTLIEGFHYFKDNQVAKQSANRAQQKGQDRDIIYGAINKILNATIYYRENPIYLIDQDEDYEDEYSERNYCLIICDKFKNCYKAEGDSWINIEDSYFIFGIDYAYLDTNRNSRNKYFLIDVVDFNKFDDFWDEIEKKDIRSITDFIRYNEE